MTKPKNRDNIPAWQDKEALCRNTCLSPGTVDNWVSEGILPPPYKIKSKTLWKWSEVDEMLTAGGRSPDAEAERIKNGTRQAANARH